MLSTNDLQNGSLVVFEEKPYKVLKVTHLHKGRGGSSTQTSLKNLITGEILERNFKAANSFKEAEINKITAIFIYAQKGEFWFSEISNPKNRFKLSEKIIGNAVNFLKPNLEIVALKFKDNIINIELPITADYKVIEAPPSIRGNTAQGGTKAVTIETGAQISTPLFINVGDIIKINTETEEYIKRVEKEK